MSPDPSRTADETETMGEWIVSLAGTDDGRRLAVMLAILAACLHATVSAMQKGRFDPWTARAAIDLGYGSMAAPLALFVFPWPEANMWLILALAWVVHAIYKFLQGTAFSLGALTVVYPVSRGIGPLLTVLAAGIVFGEAFTLIQWTGVLTLVAGIFGLAILNYYRSHYHRATFVRALVAAVFTGVAVAGYTTIDAFGVRSTTDPFTFLAWLFFVDGMISLPAVVVARRGLPARRSLLRLLVHGYIGGVVAVASFGSIMLATRLDTVGQAAVLRETSTVFAAIIGWLLLKETVGPWRAILITLIAMGAVIVEMGG